jgi:hypothetical protein
VLLGALAPIAVFALPFGVMRFVGPEGEAPAAAGVESATLDCASPRNAWKPGCQTPQSNLTRDADVTGSINDGSAASGSAERRAKRRSVAGTPSAQPDSGAAKAPSEPLGQTAAPQRLMVAQAEAARPDPSPSAGQGPTAWRDPARSPDSTQSSDAPQAPAPNQPAASRGEPATAVQDAEAKPDGAQAAGLERAGPEAKPDSPALKAPVPAGDAASPKTAPTRSVQPASREAAEPADEAEPARRPARRIARETPRAVQARASREKPRARVAEAQSVDEPVKPVRHRLRPARVEAREAAAARSERAASFRRASRRFAHHRPRAPRGDDLALSGGLRVSSVQTYYLPDGRRVVVNAPVRSDVVRDLVAQHTARFLSRRAALAAPPPAPAWGGWFGGD